MEPRLAEIRKLRLKAAPEECGPQPPVPHPVVELSTSWLRGGELRGQTPALDAPSMMNNAGWSCQGQGSVCSLRGLGLGHKIIFYYHGHSSPVLRDAQKNWHNTKDETLFHSFRQGYREPRHQPCSTVLHCLAPGSEGGCPRVCWEGDQSSENYTSQDASWPRLSQPSKGRPRRELPNDRSPVSIVGSQGGPGGN